MTRSGLILTASLAVSVPIIGIPAWTFAVVLMVAAIFRYRGDLGARVV